MKSKKNELAQSILMILKLDAKNLFDRIKNRKTDYLNEFSLKRTREHFKEIFRNRYKGTSLKDLKYCGQEVLVALDQFYCKVDDLEWYLGHTQDMLNTVEDKIDTMIRVLEKNYNILTLYVDADLGHESRTEQTEKEEGAASLFESPETPPFGEDDWSKTDHDEEPL